MDRLWKIAVVCLFGASLWVARQDESANAEEGQRTNQATEAAPSFLEAHNAQVELTTYLRLHRAYASSLSHADVTRSLGELRERINKQLLETRLDTAERLLASGEAEDRVAGLQSLHEIIEAIKGKKVSVDKK